MCIIQPQFYAKIFQQHDKIIRTNNNLENFFTELLTMKILALGLASVSAKFLKIDGLLFCSACLTMFCDGIDA